MKHLKAGLAGTVTALALSAGSVRADTVEFMNWIAAEENGKAKIEAMAEGFAAASEHEVDLQAYAWGDLPKNLFLRARSKTLPDVAQIQGRMLPTFSGIGEMQDLNAVFGKEMLEEKFSPAFLSMGEVDGKQLALPWIGGTIGWVANKEVLDAAGVEGIPVTVEDFEAALVKVRDNVPDSVPYALTTKNNNSIVLDYLVWLWTFGGGIFDADGNVAVNSEAGVKTLEFLTGLVENRLAAPEIDRPDSRRLFAQNASAFYLDATVALGHLRKFSGRDTDFDSAVLPIRGPVVNEGDEPVSIHWGHVIAIFGEENAKPDSAAAEWLMYMTSDEALIPYADAQAVLPTTKAGLAGEAVTSSPYLNEWASVSVAPRQNTIAGLENGAEVASIIGEEYQAAVLGQKSPEEAANDMQQRLEAAMAE